MLPTTTQLATEPDAPQLRAAARSDATKIFELMTRVFANRALPYTIYQAPESVRHIESLIGADHSDHRFAVLECESKLVAFYEALIKADDCFLSYIATDPSVAGHGFGSRLLRDCERMGRTFGCQRLGLDVFLSNVRAVDWYQRVGFQTQLITNLSRVLLQTVLISQAFDLKVASEDLERAVTEEIQWGFSKVSGKCGMGQISVGLIDRHCCKILAFDGLTLTQAAASVAALFSGRRDVLIIPSTQPLGAGWDIVSSEAVLRMVKPLD
ncbi:MAG: GNAT family N-acetyltransferase [Candidatus Korobacteraceae bacterium]